MVRATALLVILAFFQLPALAADLLLQVVDTDSGTPLPVVDLRVVIDDAFLAYTVTQEGKCRIELPEGGPQSLVSITATAPNHVPTIVRWAAQEGLPPESYVLRLEKGTSIGGIVRAADGIPLPEVEVRICVYPREMGREFPAITDFATRTDAEGRWRCDIVPAQLDRLRLSLRPPDRSAYKNITYSTTGPNAIESLRGLDDTVLIEPRFSLTGTVTDTADAPVAQAYVAVWLDLDGPEGRFETQTDAEGAFTFTELFAGETRVLIHAPNLAPAFQKITVGPQETTMHIALEPGNLIRGQIVGDDGAPLPKALVSVVKWRDLDILRWHGLTDDDGWFEWTGAPPEPVTFSIMKAGYQGRKTIELAPEAAPIETPETESAATGQSPAPSPPPPAAGHLIALKKQHRLVLRGSVVDAETKEPIPWFTVTPGAQASASDTPEWMPDLEIEEADGAYSIIIEAEHPMYRLKVSADGYARAISPLFPLEQGDQTFDTALEKGFRTHRDSLEIAGTIRTPDGGLAAGADVVAGSSLQGLTVHNGAILDRTGLTAVRTDPEGRFSITPETLKGVLIVVHNTGYTERAFGGAEPWEEGEIALQPWGTVEGTISAEGGPCPGRIITIEYDQTDLHTAAGIRFDYRTVSLGEGRFCLRRLPPGPARLFCCDPTCTPQGEGAPTIVQPGEKTTVHLQAK